ncbi:Dipeptidyl aminopeptidase/acylaminoacyl peptidase [Aquiflexum balticum DSM 16537]|uniref:Dipeptidyl aminopeptidase/acylaminoacyl peptidase n=1 Tax=Aquiflexum balticum DSM 16537 TaxID=758820 RepID=A0A1W2H1X7_9BACT|nr:S9 family peptidase [Aquiflexum balticum]SMD42764.1 Dipeptidyl aminopeptidase/acylaminoacyl peptidase [Aquiflexum balticum DSM 16537]
MKNTIFLSLFLVFSLSSFGQNIWTAEKIMQYKNITATNISPDGKFIAYVVNVPVMEGEKSEYNSQLWVAATDGTMDVQYTRGEKSSTAPQFSPDGKQIAFLSNRIDNKNQIFVLRLMGGEAEQITFTKSGVSSFKWSPDGKHIAYLMKDPETEEEEKRKKEKTDVILVDKDYKYNHIYTISIEAAKDGNRKTKQLTGGTYHVNGFDWSPDGSTIAFSFAPNPTINDGGLESDIATIPADSGKVTTIVKRPGVDTGPRYSPDGKWIAFQSSGGRPERVGLTDIYKVAANGGEVIELQKTPDRSANIVAWSEDGTHLFIAENYKTSQALVALPSSSDLQLPKGDYLAYSESELPILTSTNGSAGAFSVSKSGNRISFTFEDVNTPKEVFTAGIRGENAKKISSINSNFDAPPLGKTEVISWKSKDGLVIEGILTYPVDYQPGKKYPIILQIHGGPAGVFSQTYTGAPSIYMTQFFAQHGFIVLRPNPRGSTGYGKDFRYANVRDWGFGDYEDLITGVDHVLDMGIADSNNQFVMGWSYGGYMTSWIVTQTDRFNAASMGAGLPNLISMVTTTDIPDYIVVHAGGKEYWEDYEEYEKHSAIYYMKNVVTPTQVIHGANDLRVPLAQGQEFYNSLKRKGVDTEMIMYPRTPHGPTEPKFLMDVSPRILTWFEKYMK